MSHIARLMSRSRMQTSLACQMASLSRVEDQLGELRDEAMHFIGEAFKATSVGSRVF